MLEGKLLIYRDTFEVLTMLAYCRLVVDDRLSYTPAFASLERCLNLFRATMVSNVIEGLDIVDHYSLRSVASAYYNIGGALFNASKPEAAVRFARRAAEMSSATVRTWERRGEGSQEPTAGMEDSISDMRKHLSRRYELVALAHYGVGDKAVSCLPPFAEIKTLTLCSSPGRTRSLRLRDPLPTRRNPRNPRIVPPHRTRLGHPRPRSEPLPPRPARDEARDLRLAPPWTNGLPP